MTLPRVPQVHRMFAPLVPNFIQTVGPYRFRCGLEDGGTAHVRNPRRMTTRPLWSRRSFTKTLKRSRPSWQVRSRARGWGDRPA